MSDYLVADQQVWNPSQEHVRVNNQRAQCLPRVVPVAFPLGCTFRKHEVVHLEAPDGGAGECFSGRAVRPGALGGGRTSCRSGVPGWTVASGRILDEVLLRPERDLLERGQQRLAAIGQGVGDGERGSLVDGPGDEARGGEVGEPV
jgi:hypothetical protein